jgi:hypothetical protein
MDLQEAAKGAVRDTRDRGEVGIVRIQTIHGVAPVAISKGS